MPKKSNINTSAILLLVITVISCLIVGFVHHNHGFQRYGYAPNAFFMLEPDSETAEVIDDYAGIRKHYQFTIPDNAMTTTGASLSIYLKHTSARIYINKEDAPDEFYILYDSYENNDFHISHTTGNYWISFPIRPEYAGRKLKLELTPVYKSAAGLSPRFEYQGYPMFIVIPHEQLLNMILIPQEMPLLVLTAIAMLSGIALLLFTLLLDLDKRDKTALLLLGLIALLSGVFRLPSLKSFSMLLDKYVIEKDIWFIGAISYLLLPLLTIRLFHYSEKKQKNKATSILNIIMDICVLIILILQAVGVLELHEVLVPWGIAASFALIICLYLLKPSTKAGIFMLLFPVTFGIDIVICRLTEDARMMIALTLYSVLMLIIRGFLFIQSSLHHKKIAEETLEELRTAQLQALTSQVTPHFINNALTSIYALTGHDSQRAMTMIDSLSTYLSSNYKSLSMKEMIPFEEELKNAMAYIDIQKLRFGDKLEVSQNLETTDFSLPPFTLQPLLENAIKHGMKGDGSTINIAITTSNSEKNTVLTISDDGNGYDNTQPSSGIGISNVQKRLELMCNGSLDISGTTANENPQTVVTVTIPW